MNRNLASAAGTSQIFIHVWAPWFIEPPCQFFSERLVQPALTDNTDYCVLTERKAPSTVRTQ